MNKHLFVIFLVSFSCGLAASHFASEFYFGSGQENVQVADKRFVPIACGLEMEVEHLIPVSPSKGLRATVLTILNGDGHNASKAEKIVTLIKELKTS